MNKNVLEAHGTGTALGDPIEVGAAIAALCKRDGIVHCTSLKGNVGHLEAVAGGAGAMSLLSASLRISSAAPNAELQKLNPHLGTLVRAVSFANVIGALLPCFDFHG